MEGRARLLVVDDDPDVLTVLKTKLEQTGRFEVLTASGGEEALRSARSHHPEVIVSDIDMPDMDGGELAATLREGVGTARIPVIFLSALVSPSTTAQTTASGSPLLSKRGSLELLIRTIDRTLAAPPPKA